MTYQPKCACTSVRHFTGQADIGQEERTCYLLLPVWMPMPTGATAVFSFRMLHLSTLIFFLLSIWATSDGTVKFQLSYLVLSFRALVQAFLAVLSSYLFLQHVSQEYTAAPYCRWAVSPWSSWTSLRGLEEEKGDEGDGNTTFLENGVNL